ncbi:hypothetical protein MPH_07557 [Macrophomina phaseolina MS6]|uniref:NAD(P)-binding domain-containing protein n=1 Tax=Macrophomina phaseolina (strain MS6) TaxID=1126212 RepID=K2RKL3_MACPH|nr:hypothetical protein MPH_07557 [Macrophomina phaseolina MS6]
MYWAGAMRSGCGCCDRGRSCGQRSRSLGPPRCLQQHHSPNGVDGSCEEDSGVWRQWLPCRSGEPTWSSVSASPDRPSWASSVQWHRANVLNPDEYQQHLDGADAVVHSMGILLEADYKGVLQGRESPLKGLSRAFSASKQGSQNPLERKPGEELRPQEKDGQLTYELMNRDSAILLAKEASSHRVPTFVYISAAAGAPILPKRYITTKREAESTISSEFPSMRSIFIRAPFMWDSSRGFTLPIAAAGGVASLVNSAVGGRLTWLMGAGGIKPLKADLVGEAVVEAVEGGETKGPVEVPEIEALATKHWRRNML